MHSDLYIWHTHAQYGLFEVEEIHMRCDLKISMVVACPIHVKWQHSQHMLCTKLKWALVLHKTTFYFQIVPTLLHQLLVGSPLLPVTLQGT